VRMATGTASSTRFTSAVCTLRERRARAKGESESKSESESE